MKEVGGAGPYPVSAAAVGRFTWEGFAVAASLLDRMRANPRADWTIADVERLCRQVA